MENGELGCWEAIQDVIDGLLSKKRSTNYKSTVQKMMDSFQRLGVNMSLKIHCLHHHLDYFAAQLSTESDEQGERHHQIAMPFEKRYSGKKSPDAILAEICWGMEVQFEATVEKELEEIEEGEEEEEEERMDTEGESDDDQHDDIDIPYDDYGDDYEGEDDDDDNEPIQKKSRT